MRAWLALALVLGCLAGCTTQAPPATLSAAEATPLEPPQPIELANGTYQWHELKPGPYAALTAYEIASQTTANPCLFDGKPYFNNRKVPTAAPDAEPQNGTLDVHLDWTDTDFTGKTLVVAYRAPGVDDYQESDRIPRGDHAALPVHVAPGSEDGGWELWLCINDDSSIPSDPGWQNGPVLGAIHVEATFFPDAVATVAPHPAS